MPAKRGDVLLVMIHSEPQETPDIKATKRSVTTTAPTTFIVQTRDPG